MQQEKLKDLKRINLSTSKLSNTTYYIHPILDVYMPYSYWIPLQTKQITEDSCPVFRSSVTGASDNVAPCQKAERPSNLEKIWLVVSTPLKNISQIGNLPQIGVKIKNLWNHHPEMFEVQCQHGWLRVVIQLPNIACNGNINWNRHTKRLWKIMRSIPSMNI